MLALPTGLGGELEAELTPPGVEDGLPELGFRQGSDRKILNNDSVVLADKTSGEFVEMVFSLVGNRLLDDLSLLTEEDWAVLSPLALRLSDLIRQVKRASDSARDADSPDA